MKNETSLQKKVFKLFFPIHFAVSSLGFLKIIDRIVFRIEPFLSISVNGVTDWAASFSPKLPVLVQYGLSGIGLFFYYLAAYWITGKFSNTEPRPLWPQASNKMSFIIYFTLVSLFNIYIFASVLYVSLLAVGWLVLFCGGPFLLFKINPPFFKLRPILAAKKVDRLVVLIVICLLGTMFLLRVFRPAMIANDYMNMPGITKLDNGNLVDNIEFVNKHKVAGLIKNDPRTAPNAALELEQERFKIMRSPDLDYFINHNNNGEKYRYLYDDHRGELILHGPMSLEDKNNLTSWVSRESDREVITVKYREFLRNNSLNEINGCSNEVKEFIGKNSLELLDQSQAGWFFYHHNYFFGPMNALSLGDSAKNQLMIYGWLATVTYEKIMQLFGGINYQNYFKIFNLTYFLYYLIFIAGVWVIYRRSDFTGWAALGVIASLFLLGSRVIDLAPGLNPIRHFLDIFIFIFLYRYLQNRRFALLFGLLALSLFSVLWSKEFGLFILLAVCSASFIFELYPSRNWGRAALILLTTILGLALYVFPFSAANPAQPYALTGICTPSTPKILVHLALISISLIYIFITLMLKASFARRVFVFALFIYCQLLGVYFVWYPQTHHLFSLAAPYLLLLISMVDLWDTNQSYGNDNYNPPAIYTYFTPLLLVAVLILSVGYYRDKSLYEKNFDYHKIYNWDFKKASFQSTMDPTLFEEASELIKKYASGNGIFLISKYDNILPVLAGKYNKMPFNELPTNLVTEKEISMAAAAVLDNKPHYVFVDSGIEDYLNGEVFVKDDPCYKEFKHNYLYESSLSRVMVLSNLKKVYDDFKQFYRPVEKSKLITVYEIL